jgi:nicotinate-nucleotide pyrophosphorylase (carboxylating)
LVYKSDIPSSMKHDYSDTLISLALAEDIGEGDVTAQFFIPAQRQALAYVTVRETGVVSGVELAAQVFLKVDPSLEVAILMPDASHVSAGAQVIRVEGTARSILTAERTALNFLQHLSGIASLTATYVEIVRGTTAKILDTRKTRPGYRFLEKKAVADGGGTNHRHGLYDLAMVKDNHLVAEGGLVAIQAAINALKLSQPHVGVEMEADNLTQVADFLQLQGVSQLLLDNMSMDELRQAVALRGSRVSPMLEASGGVTLATLRTIAETGVDFISVGALTHSAPALDIGLDFENL